MKRRIIYLMTIWTLLLIGSTRAMAQPGGLNPLVGSTHKYSVSSAGGGLQWTISPSTGYTMTGGTTNTATIIWTAAGDYVLTLTETSGATCKTVKQVNVKVDPNTFDVYTANPAATCNAADGVINAPASYTTHITIPVTMTTGTSWSPNWEFVFSLSGTSGTISNVKVDGVAQTLAGSYTITGISSSSGGKTLNVECDITGNPTNVQSVTLTISSARELVYNTPDTDTGDWIGVQTINAIPATTAIITD